MKNIKVLAVALVALMVSSFATAEGKVAVLNLQVAILKTAKAKQVFSELESKPDYAAMKSKFEGLRAELNTMDSDRMTNGVTWSQEKRAEYEKSFKFKKTDFDSLAQKLQLETEAANKKLMKDMRPKVQKALAQLIEAENIGLVLKSAATDYASAEYDITAKITALINKM